LTADTVNASFQGVGGRVISVEVTEQQDVKKGDVIMKLDTTDIDLQIAQLETGIAQQDIKIQQAAIQTVRPEELEKQTLAASSAEESLEQAKNTFERYKTLYSEGAISKMEYEKASSQYEIAKNTYAQQKAQVRSLAAQNSTNSRNYEYGEDLMSLQKGTLESQLEALKLQRERMVLKAPIDGKITKLVPKAGENITSNATAAIIQSNNLYYSIYVDETQVSKFEKGDIVAGKAPALKKEIKGKVRSVASAPQYASLRMSRDKGQSDTSSYIVIVDVKASSKLLPGMTVEVDIDECNS
jgi:HlyD family secretion protein